MTTEFTFGKHKYHIINEICNWCEVTFGHGKWTFETPLSWDGMGKCTWVVHQTFGTTVFAFKHKIDATIFALKWCDGKN